MTRGTGVGTGGSSQPAPPGDDPRPTSAGPDLQPRRFRYRKPWHSTGRTSRHAARVGARRHDRAPDQGVPRSAGTACRQVLAAKDGSPGRPEALHNGWVTRPPEGVAGAGHGRPPSLVFSLSAAPSPAAATTCRRRHERRTAHPGRRSARAGRPDRTGPVPTLAGLIDVLDRADGAAARRRPHPRHAAAARAAAYRSGAVRTVPLRRSGRRRPPVRRRCRSGRPRWRGTPRGRPATTPGLLGRLTRRVALWGAGPGGAYLAWQPVAAAAPVPSRTAARRPAAGRGHGRPGSWAGCCAGPPSGAPVSTASTWPGPPLRCPARPPDLPAGRRRSRRAARAAQHPHSPARGVFPRLGARSRPGVFPRRAGSTSRPDRAPSAGSAGGRE